MSTHLNTHRAFSIFTHMEITLQMMIFAFGHMHVVNACRGSLSVTPNKNRTGSSLSMSEVRLGSPSVGFLSSHRAVRDHYVVHYQDRAGARRLRFTHYGHKTHCQTTLSRHLHLRLRQRLLVRRLFRKAWLLYPKTPLNKSSFPADRINH